MRCFFLARTIAQYVSIGSVYILRVFEEGGWGRGSEVFSSL